MEHHAVHHLHIKYRGEIYVLCHRKSFMSMKDLMDCIRFIKEAANGNKEICS